MSKIVIVDVQGYGDFIPKELAILEIGVTDEREKIAHFIFKPPTPLNTMSRDMKKQIYWLEKNHHALKWSVGFTCLSELPHILKYFTNHADKIIVKGNQKKKLLESYVDVPIVSLDYCPKLQAQFPTCSFHSNENCFCALTNVHQLCISYMNK